MATVSMKDFRAALVKLRDTRAWAIQWKIDAWAFRQALLSVLEIDTRAALEEGVTMEQLAAFDYQAVEEIQKFLGGEPPLTRRPH